MEKAPTGGEAELAGRDLAVLVRRAQRGDMAALGQLYSRYGAPVRKIVRMRLRPGLRRRYDSIDIVNETFIVAIEKLEGFELRSEAGLINWLAKIAQNNIRNKAARHSAWAQNALESLAVGTSTGAFQPEARVELPLDLAAKNEQQQALEDCMSELPEQYRDVLLIRHFTKPPGAMRDVPWATVGEELGISADAARMLHARARAEFTKLMQTRGHVE